VALAAAGLVAAIRPPTVNNREVAGTPLQREAEKY
jgi:hypothetical protein